MNPKLRLVGGWIFLAGLTAAGTYYAADAADHRFNLEAYAVHEKFGYTRATLASVTNPPVQPASAAQAPSAAPAAVAPPAPAPSPNPYLNPTAPTPQPAAASYQSPTSSYPPSQQASGYGQSGYGQPTQTATPQQVPPAPGYGASQSRAIQSAPAPQPRQGATGSLANAGNPAPDPALRDRLTDVESRAEATYAQWEPMKQSLQSMGQSLRPEITAALSSMRRYANQARSAYRAGDYDGASHALDMAEKQMNKLQQLRDE